MAKLSIVAGATSQSVNVFVQDSSSTVGAGLSGLVFNTSGLIAYYTFTGANAAATAITLATLAAVGSAYSSGGFKEIDSTNMKGLYRLDIPNAALATSKGRAVTIMLGGATNMAPLALEIELTGWDNQDGVHGGLTALPNTAVTTNASLLTSGTGTDQLSVTSGRIDVGKLLGTAWLTPGTAGTPDVNAKLLGGTAQTGRDIGASVLLSAGSGAGQLDFTSGVVKANATQWLGGTIPAVNVTGVPLVDLKYTLGTISPAAAGSIGIDWAQVANKGSAVSLTATTIATLTTYTGNTPQTGDNFARLGAPAGASVSADIAAIKSDIAEIEGETDTLLAGVNVTQWAGQTALVDANNLPKVDVEAVNASTLAAQALAQMDPSVCWGTCSGGSTTTAIVSALNNPSSLGATGQLIGRTIIFLGNTGTANLQAQASNITNSTTGATPTITFTAMTTAPANGDKFVVV